MDGASLLDLAEMIERHIRFEERELFPYLENILSLEQLQNIGAILLKEENESCALKHEDEFWRES